MLRYRVGLMILLLCPGLSYAQDDACRFSDVLLVVDRSISMRTGLINGQSKWDITRGAVDELLNNYGQSANFGLMIYPGPSGLGAMGVEGEVGACDENGEAVMCTPQAPHCSTGEVVVEPAQNTQVEIAQAMVWPNVLRDSYTPTWQTLEAAGNYDVLLDDESRNFLILITDGYQCCGLFRDANGTLMCEAEDRNLVIDRVQRLTQRGVSTYVVGFGSSVDVDTLQRASLAAGTQRPNCDPQAGANGGDRCYYQADDSEELVTVLADVARRIRLEVCDGFDNDCDGQIDEGLDRNECGGCGDAPVEVCNQIDDDCDGRIDENTERNACGGCSEDVPMEICDGLDNDCDSTVDEGLLNSCGMCGPDPVERCNALDDDCDGEVDEGMLNACGECGPVPSEACNARDDDCDGQVDEGYPPNCIQCPDRADEVCNNVDDDCDGQVDEGVVNNCGACEPDPSEVCNGFDEDCDDVADEGMDLCPQTETCLCGGCVGPCSMNECPPGAQCVRGFCIVDRCPEGQRCDGDRCVEGERDMMPPTVLRDMGLPQFDSGFAPSSPPAEDCGCNFTEGTGTSSFWLLGLVFLSPRIRRRLRGQ